MGRHRSAAPMLDDSTQTKGLWLDNQRPPLPPWPWVPLELVLVEPPLPELRMIEIIILLSYYGFVVLLCRL